MPATVHATMVMSTAAIPDMRAFNGKTMTKKRSAAIMAMNSTLAVTDQTEIK